MIAPAGVMCVIGIGRRDLFQGARQIGDASGFELDGGDAERRAAAGDIDKACRDLALEDDARDFGGDVEHVAMPARGDLEGFLVDGHLAPGV